MNLPAPRGLPELMSDIALGLAFFLCAHAPLFAILAIRFSRPSLVLGCGVLAALGLVLGLLVIRRFRSVTAGVRTVRRVDDRGDQVAGYLATYLLPFLTVAEPGWRDIISYTLFLVIVAVVYVRSDLVHINPTLYLLGWRLSAVDIGEGWSGYLLSRRPVARGAEVSAVRITDRLFIVYSPRAHDGG